MASGEKVYVYCAGVKETRNDKMNSINVTVVDVESASTANMRRGFNTKGDEEEKMSFKRRF